VKKVKIQLNKKMFCTFLGPEIGWWILL